MQGPNIKTEAIKCLMENPDSLHGKCCSYQIISEKCEHLL